MVLLAFDYKKTLWKRGVVQCLLLVVVGFFGFEKKKNSPLDRSNYSHNLLLLWSVCYQGRHICGGERKAEKCLFLHHPWQKVSVHFIFVNAFFKQIKAYVYDLKNQNANASLWLHILLEMSGFYVRDATFLKGCEHSCCSSSDWQHLVSQPSV